MLDIASRRNACEDTLRRIPGIATSAAGEGIDPLHSEFVPAQLPPLDKRSSVYPNLTREPIKVYNSDSFLLARNLASAEWPSGTTSHTLARGRGKVGVLNLASDREPAGGWRYTLSQTQEEALCYSSTLYATLKPEWYPFPNTGPGSCAAIISPNVIVFKDTLDRDLIDLPSEQRHGVVVITVAAPCHPKLTDNGKEFADASQLHDLQEKVLLILRLAAFNGVTKLVLGAMGCCAYHCPPYAVAREMKIALDQDEFEGWFHTIAFAVYAGGASWRQNFNVFAEVFEGTT